VSLETSIECSPKWAARRRKMRGSIPAGLKSTSASTAAHPSTPHVAGFPAESTSGAATLGNFASFLGRTPLASRSLVGAALGSLDSFSVDSACSACGGHIIQ
jgi:hypothetical protein